MPMHAVSKASPAPQGGWVEAPVNYLADAQVKPVTYNPPQGTGVPRREGHYRMFPVRIHDARPLADRLSLDVHGFALVRHETRVRDFFDDAAVKGLYYDE